MHQHNKTTKKLSIGASKCSIIQFFFVSSSRHMFSLGDSFSCKYFKSLYRATEQDQDTGDTLRLSNGERKPTSLPDRDIVRISFGNVKRRKLLQMCKLLLFHTRETFDLKIYILFPTKRSELRNSSSC